jgi:hypothetical protein
MYSCFRKFPKQRTFTSIKSINLCLCKKRGVISVK